MKYIDTTSQLSIRNGIMQFLCISSFELEQIFMSIYKDDEEKQKDYIRNFIFNHLVDKKLEYIQMFHLTRRLDGTDIKSNDNLQHVLINESPLYFFFQKYNVSFKMGEGHINMYYKGKLQSLEDEYSYNGDNVPYMKWRLGYFKNQDYCVNGLAFRSYLEKNHYYSSLHRCPEIIGNVERLLNIQGMSTDYFNHSKYYCIEYLIPIAEIIFDLDYPPETDEEKTIELLEQAIFRLFDEWRGSSFICDDNIVLRLSDNACIKPDWFVKAEVLRIE